MVLGGARQRAESHGSFGRVNRKLTCAGDVSRLDCGWGDASGFVDKMEFCCRRWRVLPKRSGASARELRFHQSHLSRQAKVLSLLNIINASFSESCRKCSSAIKSKTFNSKRTSKCSYIYAGALSPKSRSTLPTSKPTTQTVVSKDSKVDSTLLNKRRNSHCQSS